MCALFTFIQGRWKVCVVRGNKMWCGRFIGGAFPTQIKRNDNKNVEDSPPLSRYPAGTLGPQAMGWWAGRGAYRDWTEK